MANTLEAVWSLVPSLARLARGTVVEGHRKRPEKLLELYDEEFCPFCRYVRETLTELDLDVLVYPVPKHGNRFRPRVLELSGKTAVPLLHDPNTGATVPDSQAIAAYLYEQYGIEGKKPRRPRAHRAPRERHHHDSLTAENSHEDFRKDKNHDLDRRNPEAQR